MPFVFGYGSLLNKNTQSEPDKLQYYPAIVSGFERAWIAQTEKPPVSGDLPYKYRTTYLGIRKHISDSTRVNGVVYGVSDAELAELQARENTAGYVEVAIDPDHISYIGDKPSSGTESVSAWVTPEGGGKLPDAGAPLVQSYLDLTLIGCIDIDRQLGNDPVAEDSFSNTFLKTTTGWNGFWENDRAFPRRPRANVGGNYFGIIEELLYSNQTTAPLYAEMKPSGYYLLQ
jgi:hypothetical protein